MGWPPVPLSSLSRLAQTHGASRIPDQDCAGARDQLLAYRAPDATAPLGATLGAAIQVERQRYPTRSIAWDATPGAAGVCDVRMTLWIGNRPETLHWQVTTHPAEPIKVEARDPLTRRLSGR